MGKKIIWVVVVLEVLISWPLSLINKPAVFKKESIFYPITEQEKLDFDKKLALDTSSIKKFYYNKTTVFQARYLKNFWVMMDLNNYFFNMHPREDVSGVDYRFKYPFWAIGLLILAIKATTENKKYLTIWKIILAEMLVLSFLKQIDGWDMVLFLPITCLLTIGSRELNKWRCGWLINGGLGLLMATEIGRMWL